MQCWLARQFARPSGLAGRWLIAPWLNRISRAMNRLVLAQLGVGPRDDVLEVGFGGGGLLRRSAPRPTARCTASTSRPRWWRGHGGVSGTR